MCFDAVHNTVYATGVLGFKRDFIEMHAKFIADAGDSSFIDLYFHSLLCE